jgi:hypothetical protein
MLRTFTRRSGHFVIKGKAGQISAQLAAMAARECGRVPSFDPETASRKGTPAHDVNVRRSSAKTWPVTVSQDASSALSEGV